MERPEPRVRLCQIERGGGKLVAEGDVRAVAPLMKVLDWPKWSVRLSLPGGRQPVIDGFKSEAEVREWIKTESIAWIEKYEAGKRA